MNGTGADEVALLWRVGLCVHLCFGERFLPLLLGERDFAAAVIGDDNFARVVVDLHGRTAALNTTQLNTRDVRSEVAHLGHFFSHPFFLSLRYSLFKAENHSQHTKTILKNLFYFVKFCPMIKIFRRGHKKLKRSRGEIIFCVRADYSFVPAPLKAGRFW